MLSLHQWVFVLRLIDFFSIQIKRKKIKFAASTLQKSDLKLDLDQIFIIRVIYYIYCCI